MSTDAKQKAPKNDTVKPVKTFRHGAIAASVWRRQTNTGFEYLDFSLSRAWKTKDGKKEGYSSNFFARNGEELQAAIRDAKQFISEQETAAVQNDAADQASEQVGTNGHAVAG